MKKTKGRKGTKSHASVIFHLFVGKPPVNRFSPNFAYHNHIVIICANFGLEKFWGLGYTGGQILGSLIEMAGHPYNSAATMQRVMFVNYRHRF